MIECTRKIEFDAGHRVIGHEYKCKYLHGHRYILEVTAQANQLDIVGRVVDFGVLKARIQGWVNDNLDHNVILHQKDKVLGESIAKSTGQKIYYLKSNPTAENIALHIKYDIIPILFTNCSFDIIKLRLYETPNAYVEVHE